MICQLPQIQEMDINPLLINDKEAVVVDARIMINDIKTSKIPYDHMAICPFPSHLISTCTLKDGRKVELSVNESVN